MNVTKSNFAQALGEIRALLPTAAFVGIDLEFTGISLGDLGEQQAAQRVDDTPEERYQRMKPVAETYRIIQVGLCLMHPSATTPGGFVATPFNFYVFPEQGRVNMECGAVNFNTQHQMDWNKWIREGIPYVTAAGEAKVRQMAAETAAAAAANQGVRSATYDNHNKKMVAPPSDADLVFVEQTKASILRMCQCIAVGDTCLVNSGTASTYPQRMAVTQWFTAEPAATFLPASKADLAIQWMATASVAGTQGTESASATSVTTANTCAFPKDAAPCLVLLCRSAHVRQDNADRLTVITKKQQLQELDSRLGFRLVWNDLVRTTSRRDGTAPRLLVHNGMFDLGQ